MESLCPFGFNGIRFAVGLLLFMGSATQQIGLLWTTAGNAGFITGLYVCWYRFLCATHTAIIMSLESVFAAIGGCFYLGRSSEESWFAGMWLDVGWHVGVAGAIISKKLHYSFQH